LLPLRAHDVSVVLCVTSCHLVALFFVLQRLRLTPGGVAGIKAQAIRFAAITSPSLSSVGGVTNATTADGEAAASAYADGHHSPGVPLTMGLVYARPTKVICSPFPRCIATAAYYATALGIDAVTIEPGLAEVLTPSLGGKGVDPEIGLRWTLEQLQAGGFTSHIWPLRWVLFACARACVSAVGLRLVRLGPGFNGSGGEVCGRCNVHFGLLALQWLVISSQHPFAS
jgi:hypothetical protein